jgi:hypothetical protein
MQSIRAWNKLLKGRCSITETFVKDNGILCGRTVWLASPQEFINREKETLSNSPREASKEAP